MAIVKNTLRLGADNTEFKRAMRESNLLMNRSESQWKGYAQVLTKELDKVNNELKGMLKNVKDMEGVRGIKALEVQARSLRKELEAISGVGGSGGVGGGMGLGRMGMLGGMMMGGRGMAGLLMRLAPAIAPLLIGMQAYGAATEFASTEVQLGGVGGRGAVGRMRGRSFANLGFGRQESAQAAIQLTRETGGEGGLGQILGLARGYGMDTGQLMGAAGGFRRAGLSQEQSVKAVGNVIGMAMAGELERGRVGEFLRITAQMTEQLAAEGIKVDPEDIGKISGTLMAASQAFQARPQLIQQGLGAISNVMRKGQGAQFALSLEAMQIAAKEAGVNLSGTDILYELSTGLGKGGKLSSAQKYTGFMQALIQRAPGQDIKTQALIGESYTGLSAPFIREMLESFKKGKGFTKEEIESFDKKVKEETKTHQQRISEAMESISGDIIQAQAYRKEVLTNLGQKIAPTITEIKDGISRIAEGITDVASFFGVGRKGAITKGTEWIAEQFGAGRRAEKTKLGFAMHSLRSDTAQMSQEDYNILESKVKASPKSRQEILKELQEKTGMEGKSKELVEALTNLIIALNENTNKKDVLKYTDILSGRLSGLGNMTVGGNTSE